MSKNTQVVNCEPARAIMHKLVDELFDEHKFVTFTWRIGADRSLDQNALFHVWLTEYACHLLNKHKKQLSQGEKDGLKRAAKLQYYNETGLPHVVHKVINPFAPSEEKIDVTSSADWTRGEMFAFLNWLQMKAAGDGLVLESKGEYAKLQRKQNGQ